MSSLLFPPESLLGVAGFEIASESTVTTRERISAFVHGGNEPHGA